MDDLISIIIVNYNGKKWLKRCLDSIISQTYKNFEVVFVDNNSVDNSLEFIKNKKSKIKTKKNKQKTGISGGNIKGLEHSKGKYIFLLNNDTYLENDCLEKLIEGFKIIPNAGSIQSKIILMNNNEEIDNCGSYWTSSSFLYHYGYRQNKNLKQYNETLPFFSNKGASMMIRRDVIDITGFFDDDFWSYYEDTDLCNRIWIAGYECWYYPEATMFHALGGTSPFFDNNFIQFHNFKNKLLSFLKNFEIKTLATVLPLYFLLSIILSLFWLIKGKWRHFNAIYKSFWWNFIHFKETMIKRNVIQSFRKKSDKEIFKQVKKDPPLKYYYYLLSQLEEVKDKK